MRSFPQGVTQAATSLPPRGRPLMLMEQTPKDERLEEVKPAGEIM